MEGGTPRTPPPPPLSSIDYRGGTEYLVEKNSHGRTHAHTGRWLSVYATPVRWRKKEQSREEQCGLDGKAAAGWVFIGVNE